MFFRAVPCRLAIFRQFLIRNMEYARLVMKRDMEDAHRALNSQSRTRVVMRGPLWFQIFARGFLTTSSRKPGVAAARKKKSQS